MSEFDRRNHDFSKSMTDAQFAYIEAERRVTELEAENEKLRKLVRDMWNWLAPTAVGGAAPLEGLHDCMRELGIEVGE